MPMEKTPRVAVLVARWEAHGPSFDLSRPRLWVNRSGGMESVRLAEPTVGGVPVSDNGVNTCRTVGNSSVQRDGMDRDWENLASVWARPRVYGIRISPDVASGGNHTISKEISGDLWVFAGGHSNAVHADRRNRLPVWSPDGATIVYGCERGSW